MGRKSRTKGSITNGLCVIEVLFTFLSESPVQDHNSLGSTLSDTSHDLLQGRSQSGTESNRDQEPIEN